jgi:hypothetical protein
MARLRITIPLRIVPFLPQLRADPTGSTLINYESLTARCQSSMPSTFNATFRKVSHTVGYVAISRFIA